MPPSLLIRLPWLYRQSPEKLQLEIKAFLVFFSKSNLQARRSGLIAGIFFFSFLGFYDTFLLSGIKLYLIWFIRYLSIIPLSLFFLYLSFYNKRVKKNMEVISFILTCVCTLSMLIMLRMAEESIAILNFSIGTLLILFASYLIFRFSFFYTLLTGSICIIAYLAFSPWMPMEGRLYLYHFLQLLCVVIAAAIASFITESMAFKSFLHTKKIKDKKNFADSISEELKRELKKKINECKIEEEKKEKLTAQKKEVERKLRITKNQHRDILEIVSDACFEINLHGEVISFNTATCRITEKESEEIKSLPIFSWFKEEDAYTLRKDMTSIARMGGTSIITLDLEKRNNKTSKIRLSLSPKEDGQAYISEFYCIIRELDKKESKEKEEEESPSKDSLSPAFFKYINHSISTALNNLTGSLHLESSSKISSSDPLFLKSIKETSRDIAQLAADIKDYREIMESIQKEQKDIFKPEELFLQLLSQHKKIEKKELSFSFEIRDLPDFLQGNSQLFSKLLNKILSHSLHFTEEGYIRVLIHTKKIRKDLWLAIELEDTGPEIERESLFERKDKREDYVLEKLDLSFAKLINKHLKGEFHIDSGRGRTNKISCKIPLQLNINCKQEESKPDRESRKEKTPRILLVEDNIINQKLTLKLLEKNGYKPELAENGLEALDKIEQKKYDLILMDIQMPVMDGLTATRRIRKKHSNIPIVAFTAHTSEQDKKNCFEAGMNDIITKPIKPVKLYAMVKKWTFC